MKATRFSLLTSFVTTLALGAFMPSSQAGWGSIQGSNHSAAHAAPAQRSAPQRSEPVHSEPMHTAPAMNQARPEERPEAPVQERPEARPQEGAVRQQPGFVTEPRPEEHPVVRAPERTPAGEQDRRRMDIDSERHQSYFWSDYHAGMRIGSLPDGYRRIGVRGHDFFYFGGVYYDSGADGYVVVAPPLDAIIPELPPGAETIEGPGDNIYYYADGAFYVQAGDGYEVVTPPYGLTVSYLPADATAIVINGITYYQAYGIWYQPVFENGVTAYETVPPQQ